jgi:class 3 adenylate cyclase/tetratricopeptide (TPR) repeat protein
MVTCPNCGRENPEAFDFCPACSARLAPTAPAREVRKTVTIIFCDITGSTALAEHLDPESLRHVQSRYFDAMREAIERHGGRIEKYIGDAVMAVFGIPHLHEDDALRAARAAADMRAGLVALNKELEGDRGVTIAVRIGVNTGKVVAGDANAGQALVTGDAVNVAARLEQHAPPGDILLGDATYRLVREAVEAEPVDPLELKGKVERVSAWRLLGVRDVTSPATPRRLDSPMVGRARQLGQLRQAFDASVDDAVCQLFTVLGSAGIGKSRLVEEFLSGIGSDAEVLRGRCLPYGEGITYFPVVEAIKQAAGLADFDLPDVVETKVCSILEGDEHKELVCRHVSQLLGVAEATATEETFWAIRRFFEAVARERSLILVFDDIHWGEPTFLDLVEHIADWSRGFSILLLCMARSELLDVRPAWGGGKPNAATVSLEPLSDKQTETLIANLLGSVDLPAEVVERIIQTAEGNPLFVEQILAMLMDEGFVAREGQQWIPIGDLSAVTVPPSIQALLAARLDRLAPEERTVVQAAAVVGQDFFASAVLDLVPEDARAHVPADLMSLVRKGLIRAERTSLRGEDAFRFRHLLVRDSAYEAIPKTQRAELHERLADWLERVAGDAIVEQEEVVAYHLEQAHSYRTQLRLPGDRAAAIGHRAAAHLASAGRRASGRGDFTGAVNLLRRAVAVAPSRGAERAAILYDLGEALEWMDVNGAFGVFDEAVDLAAEAGDRSRELLARIARSAAQMLANPHGKPTDQLRSELGEAASEFEALGDEAGLAAAWTGLAELEWTLCRFERAESAARRALEHARGTGDERLVRPALATVIGAGAAGVSTPEEGLRTLDGLHDDFFHSRVLESLALNIRSFYECMRSDFDEARRLMDLAVEIAEALGQPFIVSVQFEGLGELEKLAGDPAAAERAFRRQFEILDELRDEGHKSSAAANLAHVLCALERFDEAERYAAIARTVAAEDDVLAHVAGRQAQALVLAARGETEEAERLAREAVRMYADAGSECPNYQGHAWMDLAKVLRTAGKPAEAEQAAREALALYERKGNRPSSEVARTCLQELGV